MLKPTRKKRYTELLRVTAFMQAQSKEMQHEYADIVDELERNGRLSMPTGEKVDSTLFAIRVIQAGNVRVFYVYGKGNNIYGLHGYVKKTQQILAKEKRLAEKIVKLLRKEDLL